MTMSDIHEILSQCIKDNISYVKINKAKSLYKEVKDGEKMTQKLRITFIDFYYFIIFREQFLSISSV